MARSPFGGVAYNARGRRSGAVGPISSKGGGSAPGSFIITNVSQTAGRAAGGSVITVTTNGVSGTPTSTLGTVGSITATTFQITTNAHAAGVVSWQATNGNGQLSAVESFDYLAAPVVSSIVPNNGPQTLTISVAITCTNLPPAGTGLTPSATVGGQALTGVTWNSATNTLSGTVPAGSVSGNVVVTVDTVASTGGTNLWTANPPPTDLSATNVGTTGGTGTITGANFVSGCTALAVINGTPTSLTITFVNSMELIYALATGTYTAGTWPLEVTNPDGQSDTESIFVISTNQTPSTLFGANLKIQGIASTAVVSAGYVVSVPDSSGNGNAVTALAVGASQPSYNAASSTFSQHKPSITFDGSTQGLGAVASLGLSGSGTLTFYAGVVLNGLSGIATVLYYNDAGAELSLDYTSTGIAEAQYAYTSHARGVVASLNAPTCVVAAFTSGSPGSLSISQDNQPAATTSTAVTNVTDNRLFSVGVRNNGTNSAFGSIEICEFGVVNRAITLSEQAALVQYLNLTYGVNAPPTIAGITPLAPSTAGATARIGGTGFLVGATVTVAGIGTFTPTTVTATYLDVTFGSIAAGIYDVTVLNPDGLDDTATNALVVSNSTPLQAWQGLAGTTCIGCYIPASAADVSSWADQSFLGNALVQGTPANQPTFTASDPNFNGAPSLSGFNGTSTVLATAGNQNIDGGAGGLWIFAVIHQSATGSLYGLATNTQAMYVNLDNGIPNVRDRSFTNAIVWGSAISGTKLIEGGIDASGNENLSVSNAAQVTGAGLAAGAGGQKLLCGSYFHGSFAFFAAFNTAPTTALRAALETYAQTLGAT